MTVRTERRGAVTVITLDRPEKRNAVDAATTLALDTAFNAFADDETARVAVLTGGPAMFCAGTDVVASAGPPTERGGPYGVARRELDKPWIAAVEGVAAGGGFEIALAATLIVASTTAVFSLPEVKLGLVAECGGLFRAPRALPLNVARELVLTGRPLTAARAHGLGVVTELTGPGQALDAAVALAEEIAARAPIAVRESLLAIEALYVDADRAGWAATASARDRARSSADAAEGIAAFAQRRPPHWTAH